MKSKAWIKPFITVIFHRGTSKPVNHDLSDHHLAEICESRLGNNQPLADPKSHSTLFISTTSTFPILTRSSNLNHRLPSHLYLLPAASLVPTRTIFWPCTQALGPAFSSAQLPSVERTSHSPRFLEDDHSGSCLDCTSAVVEFRNFLQHHPPSYVEILNDWIIFRLLDPLQHFLPWSLYLSTCHTHRQLQPPTHQDRLLQFRKTKAF